MKRTKLYMVLLVSTLTLIHPGLTAAQGIQSGAGRNLIAIGGGAFYDDVNGDGSSPFATLRVGRTLNRYLVAELITGYAATETESVNLTTFDVQHVSTPFSHVDLALEAQLPLRIAPYVGIASGLFQREAARGLAREQGTGISAAGGVRAWATQRVFVQGEIRARQDQYSFGKTHNFEMVIGLGGNF